MEKELLLLLSELLSKRRTRVAFIILLQNKVANVPTDF